MEYSYKFRIYPTSLQENLILLLSDSCCKNPLEWLGPVIYDAENK